MSEITGVTSQNQKGFKNFSLGSGHLILQSMDGTIWGMGDNKYGQCGSSRKASTFLASPSVVLQEGKTPLFAQQFAAGFQYSLVLDSKNC